MSWYKRANQCYIRAVDGIGKNACIALVPHFAREKAFWSHSLSNYSNQDGLKMRRRRCKFTDPTVYLHDNQWQQISNKKLIFFAMLLFNLFVNISRLLNQSVRRQVILRVQGSKVCDFFLSCHKHFVICSGNKVKMSKAFNSSFWLLTTKKAENTQRHFIEKKNPSLFISNNAPYT